jgi:hypothetical protein
MGRVLWRRRWGILSGLVRIGRHGHCGHYEQALSGGGWVRVRSLCVHLNPDSSAANRLGAAEPEVVHMKTPLLIVLGAIVLMAGSGLAIMNNACKSNHHAWCAQMSDIRHHVKTGHS